VTTDAFHAAVKSAFAEAVALEGDRRRDFLLVLRRREPEVAAEIEELLRHHDPDDTFLESSVVDRLESAGGPGAEALVGTRIGRYRLTGLIASGSMGAVYEAEQDEPRRAVAVKVLRAGAMSPRALRRFRYEAEILGRLRHPGVAQIYEAGTHADGALTAPYFAMELVPEARPLTRFVRESELSLEDTLALVAEVCHAVHHGHQKGVIHRDLKPANILVGSGGQPKVIDFGVARAVDVDPSATSGTVGGQVVGTLQYMSPEQLRPGLDDIDVRTDVYALGVVLYELVCGGPPHDLEGLSFVEAADVVRRRPMPLAGARRREARGDLEAIIAQATESDRHRRYQSAEALAEDLERFLRSEPVSASRPGLWRQFQLLARRRGRTVAAVSAVAAALVGATAVSVWFSFEAERARASETAARLEAQASAERATRVVSLLRDMITMGDRDGAAGARAGGAHPAPGGEPQLASPAGVAERELETAHDLVVGDRLVLVPGHPREPLGERPPHPHHARRAGRLAEHAEPAAVAATLGMPLGPLAELLPRRRGRPLLVPVRAERAAGAVRVVHVEDGRLREQVGRAARRRMGGVALDLDRPPLEALHEDAGADAGLLEDARVLDRDAGDALGLAEGRGHDLLLGPAAAAGEAEPGERERGAHDAEELATVGSVEHLGRAGRELPVHPLAELDGLAQIIEAAEGGTAAGPAATVRRIQRWHTEQSSPGLIWLTSFHHWW